MDPRKLAEFVDAGGCLYVSDLAGDLLALAFPELFVFDGRGGRTGEMDALVVDRGLREMSGRMIRIRFDMGSWKVLRHCQGHAVIRSAAPGEYADLPIMVSVRCGRGTVFYTCFTTGPSSSRTRTSARSAAATSWPGMAPWSRRS
ncbi:hypothetical protein IRY44_02280 [Micromonospora sp. ANENR4]|uniref:hypothetical protein n=1 Tax=Micromonospora sp. ANENR4 TaxID=2783662 RepID=UPI00188F6253|nr:hypothetical protein [Micromonospora sp. ANENR4]MBF5028555.1 hypothetical protein [Micromonospora sp. ANENR4]